ALMQSVLEKYHKVFYLAAFVLSCWSCENTQKEIDELTGKKVMVEEAKGIESYMSQDGKMRAKLTAPEMLRVMVDTTYVEFPKSLHVDFYNDSTRIESWLDSKYGKYFETLDKVYLRDSVIVINVNGDTLRCIDLWWDQNAKLFFSDTTAIFHGKDKNIYGGKGLVATQDMSSITFKEPIADFMISKEGTMQ
ncbi:MAG TPA: LPS export ABC transporter periplasmic protein LptC, partial [Chitinophagaceae bacterium]|nr:LPS export ABC transporter periplasmic protein LptC [Chitinophagaceae bacterium]